MSDYKKYDPREDPMQWESHARPEALSRMYDRNYAMRDALRRIIDLSSTDPLIEAQKIAKDALK